MAEEAGEGALQELSRHECSSGACAVAFRQLRSLQQPQGDQRCGYYALYNAIALHDATDYSRQGFEEFVATCQNVLSSHAAAQETRDKYPWRPSDIQSGLLERLYLDVLIGSIQARHPGLRILSFLEASLSSLRNNHPPIEAACELERALSLLQQQPPSPGAGSPQQLAVIVGSAIHWFVVSVRRMPAADESDARQAWEISLVDSQNNVTLLAADSVLRQIAESLSFSVWLQAGWQKPALVELAVDSFRGVNCLIELLRRRVMQEADSLVWDVVKLSVEGFIQSFPAPDSSSDDATLERLLQWNREIFPTPVVRCNIISMLRTVIAQHTAECMLAAEVLRRVWAWCQQQQLLLTRLHRQLQQLACAEPQAIETLVGLLAVFEEVQQVLQCRALGSLHS